MKRICVYCGSHPGLHGQYVAAAKLLGAELARRKLGLVYGGASIGVMGALADGALAAGGEVIGVIPKLFDAGVAHSRLTQLHVVNSMHERKAMMFELSDGFIAAPGGIGTLEEIMEVVTWAQIALHSKPCGLLNVQGYFGHVLAFIDHAVTEGFVRAANRQMILASPDPVELLELLASYRPPPVEKWLERRGPEGRISPVQSE